MNKEQSKEASLKANKEIFSLTPSALVTLFEIDASDLAFDSGFATQQQIDNGELIFRFHNNSKIGATKIIWNGIEYIAAPIVADKFETSAKGTLPTPMLQLTVNEEGIPALAALKEKIRYLDDLVGAKVTRIRTFAKYLDAANFVGEVPIGFSPDPTVELPRDIYYIDRKSEENKYTISFELASIFDVQGIYLPKELVLQNRCRFSYRGCGCLYEYNSRRNPGVHGYEYESILPESAPPVANVHNELITTIVGVPSITVRGQWVQGQSYNKGEAVFIEKHGIKYYFVSKIDNNTFSPPGINWVEDACSLEVAGCRLRWKDINLGFKDNRGNPKIGVLPYGGFPAVNKSR